MLTENNLSKNISKAISDMGFTVPTLIQEKAIPYILEGKDVIGQAQTGTGKTAAFAIPVLEKIDLTDRRVQALVLCPTRELAIQTGNEFEKIGKFFPELEVLSVYGGQNIHIQLKALKRHPQVVVGTPGRLIDHINRKTLNLGDVNIVTLDEADEMLDMGFREDINTILDLIPGDHQTLLFSATMPKPIMELGKKYMKDPVHIKISDTTKSIDNTEQIYFEVKEKNKIEALSRLIDFHKTELCLVFCKTKTRVDELAKILTDLKYNVRGLHGDLRQSQRDEIMDLFRNRKINILVATDVAARGIDIDDISIVFNFDMPQDASYYTHRIGRTGRAGKKGKAFTFASPRDIVKLRDFVRTSKSSIKEGTLPSKKEADSLKVKSFLNEVYETVYNSEDLSEYYEYYDEITENKIDPRDFIAAIIKKNMIKTESKGTMTVSSDKQRSPLRKKSYSFSQKGNFRKRTSGKSKNFHSKGKPSR